MEMTVTQTQGAVPVTVLHLAGQLDGSNHETLVTEAQRLYQSGIHDLLLELGKLTYMSSAGISALHRVALLFSGKPLPESEDGWSAFHAIDRDRSGGVQKHVKLLNPAENIKKTLEMVGFTSFFEIYSDLDQAVASFR